MTTTTIINESSIKFFYDDECESFWGFKLEDIKKNNQGDEFENIENFKRDLLLTMRIPIALDDIVVINQKYEIDGQILNELFRWFTENGYLPENGAI